MGYPLYVNIDSGSVANSLVRGSGSQASGTASPPEIVLGDKRELDFYFVDASGSYADFSGDNAYSLAIAISFPGGIKSRPSGGDFTLTFDGDTTSPLPYDISASDLEDELNGLASVISAGLLDVTGPDGGPFIITFRTTGDKSAFSADASNLEPRSQVYATTTVEGDGSTQETVVIQLRRTVAAYQNSFSVITDDDSNPIGWKGELNASTEGLVELLAGNDTVNAFFEIQVTDPSGNPRTYGQYKCTIRNQIIDPGTVSGPVLEVILTQSAADARYLQIANNLSDLDDVPDARTNLGLGSAATQDSSDFATAAQGGKADTALQPGVIFGSGVRHDSTIVTPNINQILRVMTNGVIGASGKSFGGALGIDALTFSEDIAVTSRDIFNLLGTPVRVWKAPEIITALGGGATLSTNNANRKAITLNGTGDTAWFGWQPQATSPGWGPGSSGTNFLQFGKIFTLSAFISLPSTSTGTETRFGFYRGAPYQKTGPFTTAGEMGVLIKGDRSVHLIWYDSTAGAEVEHDLGYTIGGGFHEIRLMGYHRNGDTGRLQLWVDGEIIGTVTHTAYTGGTSWYAALTSNYISGSDPRVFSVWAMAFYQSPIRFLTI